MNVCLFVSHRYDTLCTLTHSAEWLIVCVTTAATGSIAGISKTHFRIKTILFSIVNSLSENDLHAWMVTGKQPRSAEQRQSNTHSQALAMTRGESEINVSLPEPESIFKHLSIVSVWEVTLSLPPFCDTDKTKARGSTGCYFVH